MNVLAIDPGCERSAWVLWDGERIAAHGIEANEDVVTRIYQGLPYRPEAVVLEQIESYGMPVGREVFATVRWTGRFEQKALDMLLLHGGEVIHLPRRAIKLHLCNSAKAKDANIRQALIDRFGGRQVAIGKKSTPGPLYGIHADKWAALAVAVTWFDLKGTSWVA